MHPEYPCAHCITSATISTVLRDIVGDDFGESLAHQLNRSRRDAQMDSTPGLQRRSFQCAYLCGFHYRFSTEVGKEMGKKIGALTVATQLRGVEALAEPKR